MTLVVWLTLNFALTIVVKIVLSMISGRGNTLDGLEKMNPPFDWAGLLRALHFAKDPHFPLYHIRRNLSIVNLHKFFAGFFLKFVQFVY